MSKYAKIAGFLRDEIEISTFIETGILGCETTLWAADHFDRVYGLEIEPNCANEAKKLFKDRPHVTIIEGDSGKTLTKLLSSLTDLALIVLDAHFYGSCTIEAIKRKIQCPIERELAAISACPLAHSVIIDDMRFFVDRDIPEGSDITQFPTLEKIVKYFEGMAVFVSGRFLVAVPRVYGQKTLEFLNTMTEEKFEEVENT